MKLKGILSHRSFEFWPSFQLIYEWEEIFSELLKCELVNINIYTRIKYGLLRRIGFKNNFKKREFKSYYLYHVMSSNKPYMKVYRGDVIPILIDFCLSKDELNVFYENFKNCPFLLVSSLTAIEFLKENKFRIPLYHLPLSLPDQFKYEKYEKKYQILLAGRQNELLKKWLDIFLVEFPETEYVYESSETKFLYISSHKGAIGDFSSRDSFVNLLRASKVFFYSTPGMDEDAIRTNNFSFVTPRFLELVAADVRIVARYPQNSETRYYELNKICPSIEDYDQFRDVLIGYLENKEDNYSRNEYLAKHYTSNRVEEFQRILSNYK